MTLRFLGALAVAVVAVALPGLAAEGRAIDTAPSHYATVDGANGLRVHYKSFGSGDTALVFVHGWTCDLTFWRDQVDYFNGKTRIILVDLPGHGKSDKPMVAYTQDLFAQGIHAALKDAGVKKATLVGHSMGTPVIRQFYRLYPAETQALVIVDGGLRNPFPNPEAAKARLAVLESDAFQGEINKAIEGMFVPTTTPEIREFVMSRMTKAPKYVSVGAIRGQTAPGLYNQDKITVPVVAIMAKRANWTPAQADQFKELAPQVEYHAMEGVGHFLMMEKPAEFNHLVSQFLTAHKLIKST